jgi:hypothetical protein
MCLAASRSAGKTSPINQNSIPRRALARFVSDAARHGVGVAALNGKIYVAGGLPRTFTESADQFAEYDVAKDQWRQLAPSSPRGSAGLAAWAASARDWRARCRPNTVATHEVYDPQQTNGPWQRCFRSRAII